MTRTIFKLLLALACLPSAGCAYLSLLFQKPTVGFQRVDVTSVSFDGISANFILTVDNPNAIGLAVARLGYQLTVDGHAFAAGQASQAVSIPANGTGLITVPVSFKFAEFVQAVEAFFRKDTVAYGIDLTPGFDTPVGPLDLPLHHDGTFPVPKLPDVSFGGASFGGLDLSGATLNLGINVKNRNAFAVPIGTLSYAVSLSGTPLLSSSLAPGNVEAGAQRAIPLSVRVDFLKAGFGVAQAIQAGTATVGLDGALDLGFYKLPLHLSQAVR